MRPITLILLPNVGFTKHYHARTERVCTTLPEQRLQHLAYGNKCVDHKASASRYSERFTFTGKERDEESGFNYHGARWPENRKFRINLF